MKKEILRRFLPAQLDSLRVIDDVEIGGPDYGFYLLSNGVDSYVLAEASYTYATSVVPEIAHLFPVKVRGWCRLADDESSADLLPADFFTGENENEERRVYEQISITEDGRVYALLSVAPDPLSGS